MKRLVSIFLAVAMLLCLTACKNTGKPTNLNIIAKPSYPKGIASKDFDTKREIRENNPVKEKSINAIKQFSYNTAAAQIMKEIKTNDCFSPLSLYYSLAIAATGSKGLTCDELLNLLSIDNTSELSEQCGNLYRQLYTDNEISKLKIANSLWLATEMDGQKIIFKESFIENAKDHFYSSLFSADFADERTTKAMSEWISENTNGRIAPELEVDDNQIMSNLNAVYFYDEWLDRFSVDNTKPDIFQLKNGDSVTCEFMNMTYPSHNFNRGDGYIQSSLGLKNRGQMVFILPDEGVSLSKLLSSAETIEELFTQGESKFGEVVWSVPKFSYSSSFDFKDLLKAIGVNSAFSKDADFSGITDNTAFFSGVKHETHISIDENGVEASAFTNIAYASSAMPEGRADMILNRPFIYGITASNGLLLFVGVCVNPVLGYE